MVRNMIVLLGVGFLQWGCDGSSSSTDTDSGIDSDTDADTDSDSDTDADTDSDSDTDADTDRDSDTDADTDSDSDTDADTDTDGTDGTETEDSDTGTDTGSDSDTGGDPDTDTGPDGGWITMAACSQAAFEAAYASASPGDAIAFPDGHCDITWSGSTEFAKSDLIIRGQGTSDTILRGVHWITRGGGANGLRITGIRFVGPTSGILFDAQLSGGNRPENIRIDHNEFDDVYTVTQWGSAEKTAGVIPFNCVVDNNVFNIGSHAYTQNYAWGDCDSTEEFPFSMGTADGIYFEDNVINDPSGDMGHFIASRCGSRYVIRHNRFNVVAWDTLDAHDSNEGGGRDNGIRGSWTTEIYGNEFVFNATGKRIIHLRGGQHVIWNNHLNTNQSNGGIKLTSYNIVNGGCTYQECTTGDRICSDGRWCDLINHTYVWGNRYNCGSDMANCASGSTVTAIDDNNDTVVQGADYFLSQAPGYSPLAYPHPRR